MNTFITQSRSVFLALMLLVFSGANASDAARGAELLLPFKMQLKQALVEGLQEGPLNAIAVCRIEAPQIADALSNDDMKVGRTSHRLRNPENIAPEWVDDVLAAYLADDSDREPQLVRLEDDRYGYVEPISTAPLCLACHGDSPADDVEAKIKELYPDDKATGFKLDELRGVFWLEYSGLLADEG